jgi:hypothetical protein
MNINNFLSFILFQRIKVNQYSQIATKDTCQMQSIKVNKNLFAT